MDVCCKSFPLSETLIDEVWKSSLYKNKSHNVRKLLTEEEYKQFKPSSKTMFAANKLI